MNRIGSEMESYLTAIEFLPVGHCHQGSKEHQRFKRNEHIEPSLEPFEPHRSSEHSLRRASDALLQLHYPENHIMGCTKSTRYRSASAYTGGTLKKVPDIEDFRPDLPSFQLFNVGCDGDAGTSRHGSEANTVDEFLPWKWKNFAKLEDHKSSHCLLDSSHHFNAVPPRSQTQGCN